MADKLGKRPSKGILKNSSSFDKAGAKEKCECRKSKETKWDEMNIIATLHPADKDYGHMKVDEPKTPYNYENPDEPDREFTDEIDAGVLADKLKTKAKVLPKFMERKPSFDDDEDYDLTPEERERRKSFEAKRKQHYNEYYAVKLAKKKLEEEDDEDDDDDDAMDTEKTETETGNRSNSTSPTGKSKKSNTPSPSHNPK